MKRAPGMYFKLSVLFQVLTIDYIIYYQFF